MTRKGRKSQKRKIKLFFKKAKRLKIYPRSVDHVTDFFRKENFVTTYLGKKRIIKNAHK